MNAFIDDYFPISLSELTPGQDLSFDIWCFLKLNQKIILLRKKGETFSAEALEELKNKEVFFLYVHEKDKTKYQDFLAEDIAQIFTDRNLSKFQKLQRAGDKTQDILAKIRNTNTPQEAQAVMDSMNNFSQGIIRQCSSSQFSNNFTNLQRFLKKGSDLTVHSLNVSSLCIVFALALKRFELPFVESLAQAGLIHDLALVDLPPTIVEQYLNFPGQFASHLSNLPADDPYFNHTLRLIQIIEVKGLTLPGPVKDIIAQHHENHDGSGFPRGLGAGGIHLGAKILRICNDYEVKFRAYLRGNEMEKVKSILSEMQEQQRTVKAFDPRILEALVTIIEGEQKPGGKVA